MSRFSVCIYVIIHFLIVLSCAPAEANFHTVGIVNTIIPGGGRLIMGEFLTGVKEAAIEVTTFDMGYSMFPHGALTLDGTSTNHDRSDFSSREAKKSLLSTSLQEFGLKFHMMNVFWAYRDQYNLEGGDPGQGIDQRSAKEMFKDPFRLEIISSPWFYIPLAFTAAFAVADYHEKVVTDKSVITPIKMSSKKYLAFEHGIVFPTASGAPEETFYRGFVQNEFYYLVRSPYFSIPMSSLVFAFSHHSRDWPGTFVAGLYQGMLSYKNNGDLSYGNALHFWGVFLLGIETYLLTLHSASVAGAPPAALNFHFTY